MNRLGLSALVCALAACSSGGSGSGGGGGGGDSTNAPVDSGEPSPVEPQFEQFGLVVHVTSNSDRVDLNYHPSLGVDVPAVHPSDYCPALTGVSAIDGREIAVWTTGGMHTPFPPCDFTQCYPAYCVEPSWESPTERALPDDSDESTVSVASGNDRWTMKVPHLYAQRVMTEVSSTIVGDGGTLVYRWTPATDFLPDDAMPVELLFEGGGGVAMRAHYDAGVLMLEVPPNLVPPGAYRFEFSLGSRPIPSVSRCDGPARCDVDSWLPTLFCLTDGSCDAGTERPFTLKP